MCQKLQILIIALMACTSVFYLIETPKNSILRSCIFEVTSYYLNVIKTNTLLYKWLLSIDTLRMCSTKTALIILLNEFYGN
jgi:hypothetical protein